MPTVGLPSTKLVATELRSLSIEKPEPQQELPRPESLPHTTLQLEERSWVVLDSIRKVADFVAVVFSYIGKVINMVLSVCLDCCYFEGEHVLEVNGKQRVGIPNIGNSCYLNSVLQTACTLPVLCERLIEDPIKRSEESDEDFAWRFRVVTVLREIQANIDNPEAALAPFVRELRTLIAERNSDVREGIRRQQDALVVLSTIFCALDMHFLTSNRLCDDSAVDTQLFLSLGFPSELQTAPTAQQLIDDYFARDEFRHLMILEPPPVLAIQLKRFNNNLGDIRTPVLFPDDGILDFSSACGEPVKYKVRAFVTGGGRSGGHYTSYLMENEENWVCCNDWWLSRLPPAHQVMNRAYLFLLERVEDDSIEREDPQ